MKTFYIRTFPNLDWYYLYTAQSSSDHPLGLAELVYTTMEKVLNV